MLVLLGLFRVRKADFSPIITITVEDADLLPPLPNPPEHVVGYPDLFTYFPPIPDDYYVIVLAEEATDQPEDSIYGVEYKFVCLDDPSLSSGASGDPVNNPEWRNEGNVDGLFYVDGGPQDPEKYMAQIISNTGSSLNLRWVIYVRDMSPNHNIARDPITGDPIGSEPHSISNPMVAPAP